ncbi:hypothetical protein LEP1GSC059_0250 [Leptospira noguchii serovar Panama str. CZ214]|uniref:Uncharacterized protein n=1 Tax=Leptospira noguchii serovar Panama str. CZ214 TaxID=1001595 RepID=T0GX50_9LEPT|nr:hypothetical protein LEP1GSC059_0250 [Leptospira noguchii serovar Panama str. CZ214]
MNSRLNNFSQNHFLLKEIKTTVITWPLDNIIILHSVLIFEI